MGVSLQPSPPSSIIKNVTSRTEPLRIRIQKAEGGPRRYMIQRLHNLDVNVGHTYVGVASSDGYQPKEHILEYTVQHKH